MDVQVAGVAKDSLGARRIGAIAFEVARAAPDLVSLLVTDADIVAARAALWSDLRIAAEHGAAAAHAALTSGAYVPAPGERVVTVVCGANTDPATLAPRLWSSDVPRGSPGQRDAVQVAPRPSSRTNRLFSCCAPGAPSTR